MCACVCMYVWCVQKDREDKSQFYLIDYAVHFRYFGGVVVTMMMVVIDEDDD